MEFNHYFCIYSTMRPRSLILWRIFTPPKKIVVVVSVIVFVSVGCVVVVVVRYLYVGLDFFGSVVYFG